MSWPELLRLIEDEAGPDVASRIEDRARVEFGGLRLTVLKRKLISVKDIDRAAPGKPKEAARKLGVSKSTVYRLLQQRMLIR